MKTLEQLISVVMRKPTGRREEEAYRQLRDIGFRNALLETWAARVLAVTGK